MNYILEPFGKIGDNQIYKIKIININNVELCVSNYGASITNLYIPHGSKKLDVVLGYDDIMSYTRQKFFSGATIGRVCNRIAGGKFSLNSAEYKLTQNEGRNHLHGGLNGFDKKVWNFNCTDSNVTFTYISKDMEEGYPGNLYTTVKYSLNDKNEVNIKYSAISDKTTLLSLTNHAYFNLNGHDVGDILGHRLQIFSDKINENSLDNICTENIINVDGSPFNFTYPKEIGKNIKADNMQLKLSNGYDHNYIFGSNKYKKMASVQGDISQICMDVYSDCGAMHFYSGNYLDSKVKGKGNAEYTKNSAFALETQCVPNAINMQKFSPPILEKGGEYKSKTTYKFSNFLGK